MIQDYLRVHLRLRLESNTHREVGLNHTGDNLSSWRLCCNNQVNSTRAPHLRQGYDGGHNAAGVRLGFRSAGAKYQLRVFINDYNNVGQEPVTILRIQFVRIPFIKILQEVRRPGLLKQRISVRHLLTKRTKGNVRRFRCLDHSPGLLIILRTGVLRYGQIMLHEAGIIAKLRFLRVDEHQFQLGWTLSIEEGSDNHIQPNRLTLLCGTGNQEMRGIRKIEDLHVAGDLLTDGDGQFSRTGTEFFRRHQFSYRY